MKVSFVVSIFSVLVKLLERISKTSDKASRKIEVVIDKERLAQAAIEAEGARARRISAKLKDILS